MDKMRYQGFMEESDRKFEAICSNCGECCGSKDDPCQNLVKNDDGTYKCRDYINRLGPQKTVSGKIKKTNFVII